MCSIETHFLSYKPQSAPSPPMGIARPGTRSALGRLGPAELEGADWPREDRRPKAAQRPSTESGRIRIRRRRVRGPRHRRPAGGARRPEAPLPRGRPARRRGHRARQQGPEEGAHLSAGVRRPRPAPPRARPTRPAARRGDGASGAGLHGPRGVRERGIVPAKNAWLAVADPPPARTSLPPWRSRRRLIYKMVGMPAISLPASPGRLPRRRPK